MSDLLAHGHTDVARWPLARVWAESALLQERRADDVRAQALAVYQAASTVMAGWGGKASAQKASRQFNEWLRDLG